MNPDQKKQQNQRPQSPKQDDTKVVETELGASLLTSNEPADVREPAAPDTVTELEVGSDDVEPESNLITHAKYELALIGEDQETIDGYLKVIQAFADMGHSGGSASFATRTLNRLFQYKNLSEITDNPEEWREVGPNLWQSLRSSNLFSEDGGKSYTDVNDHGVVKQRHGSAQYSPKAV